MTRSVKVFLGGQDVTDSVAVTAPDRLVGPLTFDGARSRRERIRLALRVLRTGHIV